MKSNDVRPSVETASTAELICELQRRSTDSVIILGRPDSEAVYRYHAIGSRDWLVAAMAEVRRHLRERPATLRIAPAQPPPFSASPLNLGEGGNA